MPPRRSLKDIGSFSNYRASRLAASSLHRSSAVSKYRGRPRLVRAKAMSKEVGYVDVAATMDFNTTGTITLLNTIAQGVTINQRVGKKVILKHLQCRGIIGAQTTATSNRTALLVVYDKRPNGSLPAITDILETANSLSLNNTTNEGRFSILMRDDRVLMGATALGEIQSNTSEVSDFFLRLNKPTTFKALATGAIADQEEGALYLVSVGNQNSGTADAQATLQLRLRFEDV